MDDSQQSITSFVCPTCMLELSDVAPDPIQCTQCSYHYFCQNGIPLFLANDMVELLMPSGYDALLDDEGVINNFVSPSQTLDWENLYRRVVEPWAYSSRAVEILKYRFLLKICGQLLDQTSGIVVDVGCSLGRLSADLALRGATVMALDISPTAMHRAKELYIGNQRSPKFAVASCTRLPIATGMSDLVIIADGLFAYNISLEDCHTAIREANRVLKNGGKIVLMDYMKPEAFDSFVDLVRGNGFQVEAVHLLYDRLSYGLEMGLQAFHHHLWCQQLLANTPVAHLLSLISRLLGKIGSRHICVIATKIEVRLDR
jgi:SAM-dependent methyltransferase/DNA-directed RNA polymerase subunit RPC12/RpoP